MKLLIPVEVENPVHVLFLFDLLKNRPPDVSISHRSMPTFIEHHAFLRSQPYDHHYLICLRHALVGSCYLTAQNEIGIHLRLGYQHKGCGSMAVKELMAAHPRPFYRANINPANDKSISFFHKLGFHDLQLTLTLDASVDVPPSK
jgi:RimJ/RimL family protein N-acetyltransferase